MGLSGIWTGIDTHQRAAVSGIAARQRNSPDIRSSTFKARLVDLKRLILRNLKSLVTPRGFDVVQAV